MRHTSMLNQYCDGVTVTYCAGKMLMAYHSNFSGFLLSEVRHIEHMANK